MFSEEKKTVGLEEESVVGEKGLEFVPFFKGRLELEILDLDFFFENSKVKES